MQANKKDWLRDLVIYQVYPAQLYGLKRDGIGDLNGVRQKLPYLQELGVNALWLSPFFCSPGDDNGYDISDYQNIQPEFGTMEDCEALIRECHQRGMRILFDLVVNHTSDEHPWFLESSSSRDNGKSDYYIWRDPVDAMNPPTGRPSLAAAPGNMCPPRGQYYFHLFSPQTARLNWRCPDVKKAIFSMMAWWAQKGAGWVPGGRRQPL